MTTKVRNVLAVAANASKVGYVFIIDGTPYDWDISLQANETARAAHQFTTEWIAYYQPELLVTERIQSNSQKGERSRDLIDAIWKAAQDAEIRWACVDRVQTFPNKYIEAAVLAERFPELMAWLPKTRTLWDEEPRRMIIFEALALGLSVTDGTGEADTVS